MSDEISAEVRPSLTFNTMGHVDAGKSTLIGYLLHELGVVKEDLMRKIEREVKRRNVEDEKWAFIMERTPEERLRLMTQVPSHFGFRTEKYDFTVIDCPGHKSYVRNMIIGTTQADAGVLVVSADSYESAIGSYKKDKEGEWFVGQAREHAYIARILGIDQLIVAISKMDLVSWDEGRYRQIQNDLARILKLIGYGQMGQPEPIFVPVGGKPPNSYGVNVVKSDNSPGWHTGPTFKEALEMLRPPIRARDLPLRIPIERVYAGVPGTEVVLSGKIEAGHIAVEDKIVVEPDELEAEVRSIKLRHEGSPTNITWPVRSEAVAGDVVSIAIRGNTINEIVRGERSLVGRVISHLSEPAKAVDQILARIYVLWHPKEITRSYSPTLHVGTAVAQCVFEDIVKKYSQGGLHEEDSPSSIVSGEAADVRLGLRSPMVVDSKVPRLNRLLIRDQNLTVAGGLVLKG